MSDNKLKIRIQIQQPPQAIEQIHPELSEPVITYEQSLDWRRISIAAVLLLSVIALIGYFLFGANKNEIPSNEAAPSIGQTISTHENKISSEKTDPEPESKDKTIEIQSIEHNNFSDLTQPEEITVSISKPKPDPIINQQTITDKKIPKTAALSKPQKQSDHPQVHRAQLSHAIKALEPVDSIDVIQLRQGESRPIHFYLHLMNLQGKKISVRWYHKNKLDSQLPLEIHNNDWRTYASKQLDHQRLGIWRVELMDESGNRLATRNFTVTTH